MTQPVDPAEPREKLAPVTSDDVRSPRSARSPGTLPDPDGDGPRESEASPGGDAEVTPGGSDGVGDDVVTELEAPDLGVPHRDGGDVDPGTPGSTPAESAGDGTAGDMPGASAAADVLAAERLADLQRLQAEYVNYKRRVDRDRSVVQERVVRDVLESLLPVLDDIHAAREHGDLTGGPFAAIADKLEATLGRYGLARFGSAGEEFDPVRHEALMHTPWPDGDTELPTDSSATTVVTVLQPGYRAGDHVLRPARVAVADPP
ncbi:MAG: nucleotide exchange factor GrpE [Phycicoccus sp.]